MASKNDTKFFEKKLVEFATSEDPMLETLQWTMNKFMEIEVTKRTGAEKSVHSTEQIRYRSGYRVRRFDTRLGTAILVNFFLVYEKHYTSQ